MNRRILGPLGPVSALTLGGGGLGMLWGATTFDECVATVRRRAPAEPASWVSGRCRRGR